MGKIIICNKSQWSDAMAVHNVESVIRQGRISNEGQCYCYATRIGKTIIYATKNKASDTFTVFDA